MLEKEISRRNFVRFSVVGAGATAVAESADPYEAQAETIEAGTDYPNQIKIVHLSDVHYFSQKLYAVAVTSLSRELRPQDVSASQAPSLIRPSPRSWRISPIW